MKKTILTGLISLMGTFAFANDDFGSNYLNLVNNDIQTINKIAISNLQDMNNNKLLLINDTVSNIDNEIKQYNSILNNTTKLTTYEINEINNAILNLSNQTLTLAEILAYIGNDQLNNMNEDYKTTFISLVNATLRLSDDIGKMADRIGVMSDRILETQKIQSVNYNKTLQLLSNFSSK